MIGRWTARHQRLRRFDHLSRCRGLCPAQPFELEMIGGDDVGERAQAVAHQRRDVGMRRTGRGRDRRARDRSNRAARVAGFGARDEIRDHGGDLGRAEIAGQDHLAALDRAAFLDAAQEIGDQWRLQHAAADARVTRPVAQQRGRHGDHVDAVHLQGKHGGAVADMAEGDLRLDGNDGHAVGHQSAVDGLMLIYLRAVAK